MSKWDDFTGGQEANERTQAKIDAYREWQRQTRLKHIAYALLAGAVLFSLYMIFTELGQLPPGFLSEM